MAKESLFHLDRRVIFHEGFQSLADIINGGCNPTNIVIQNGIAKFNGTSSKINCGIKLSAKQGAIRIIAKIDYFSFGYFISQNDKTTTGRYIAFGFDSSKRFRIIFNDGVVSRSFFTTVNYNIDTWYDIVFQSDGSAYKIFVNGSEISCSGINAGEWFGDTTKNTGNFDIGLFQDTIQSLYYDGDIELIDIYDQALTAEEVQLLYENSLYRGLIREGLILFHDYVFYQNSEDISYNGNNGIDTDIVYKKKGAEFNNGTAKIEIGNISATLKTIIVVASPNTTTEEFIDLDGTNKMNITAGTLACGGFANKYVNGIAGTTVVAGKPQFMAVTDSTGVNASDFDIGENSFDGTMQAIVCSTTEFSAKQIAQCYQYFKQRNYI